MNKIIIVLLLITFLGCNSKKKLTLIKQWHLANHQNTLDIEKSKTIGQYRNQIEIYKNVAEQLKKNSDIIIYAEGCEGDIKTAFQKEFNGWSLEKLKTYVDKAEFEHILAPIPMKLMAKFPNASIYCGDDDILIKENLKALSDVRGFSGFYQKLKQFKMNNPPKFEIYKKQLLSLYPDATEKNVLRFSLEKAKDALKNFELILAKRNDVFLKNILENNNDEFIVIIGGLHTFDLENKAASNGIETSTITPKFYSKNESLLISGLKNILNSEVVSDVTMFQMPHGIDLKKFPRENFIDKKLLLTMNEEEELKRIVEGKIDFSLLLSDYDNDGIRDFTLSSSKTNIVLSAEDPDWDNDGIDNLFDNTVGDIVISKAAKGISINNNFFSTKKKEEVLKKAQGFVKVGNSLNIGHELLVLELFNQILPLFPIRAKKLRNLIATTPKISYGEKVFFSYISQSKTIEYYPEKLNSYVNNEFQMRFKGVKFERFIQSFIVPVIVHSLAHEFAHIQEDDLLKEVNDSRWNLEKIDYKGLYLKAFRVNEKKISKLVKNQKFMNKTFKDWVEDYKKYTKEVNGILKESSKTSQMIRIKKSQYYTTLTSDSIEHLLSYFKKYSIPSIYSMKNFNEWRAEVFASCVYKKIFANSKHQLRSIELEHLIGFYPKASNQKLCQLIEKKL